ncbi:VWA domain-containing protein [Hoeflea prorocentri]|uniref:VWA domain-containing protein n=1 Tax=Hoeflea prorocentri TaxID=1922333 RepID=A0A9X3UMQ1_9HYPH|nr:VWA domain-containing protein [Hoeflea prorocentri]MCY6383225.1 VWA domain-containing protein [Hoeflea prorocentri]MDA5401025.1 VWA domain-containing protein [Hoeflea prorocentri]
MLFALAIGVVFLATGLAVDYSMGLLNKTRVNNALDAATIATARAIAAGDVDPSVSNEAENYLKAVFAANLGVDDVDASKYDVSDIVVDTASQEVSAKASVNQGLYLTQVKLDEDAIKVASSSGVSYGISEVEVAMVLDVTGSMKGSRLKSLKKAAQDAVETLLAVNTPTDTKVRISIVPYAIGVNVGADLADYVYADSFKAKSDAPVYDASQYSASNKAYYDVEDFQDGYSTCHNWDVAYKSGGYFYDGSADDCWPFVTESSDNSNSDYCASERKAPLSSGKTNYQYTDKNPSFGLISRDARLNEDWCPSSPVVLLSDSETTLDNAITGFRANGWTAGHIGLQWGWYTISHNWSDYFPAGSKPADHKDPDEDVSKYIIMMTDGVFNTAYSGINSYGFYSGYQSATAYDHFESLCSQIKSDGITIFSIGYGLSDGSTAEMELDDCATDDTALTQYFYDADTSTELAAAFEGIADTIQNLRLTH